MSTEDLLLEIKQLREENEKLKNQLENQVNSRKLYYEKNKAVIKEKAKEGLKKLAKENPEKLKEYRRTAYLKQKEKNMNIQQIK